MIAARGSFAAEMYAGSEEVSPSLAKFGPEAPEPAVIDRPGSDRPGTDHPDAHRLGTDHPVIGRPVIDRPYLATKLVWEQRRFIANFVARGALLSLLIAFLIPSSYESKAELMPPDSQSAAMGTLAALTGGSGGSGATSG